MKKKQNTNEEIRALFQLLGSIIVKNPFEMIAGEVSAGDFFKVIGYDHTEFISQIPNYKINHGDIKTCYLNVLDKDEFYPASEKYNLACMNRLEKMPEIILQNRNTILIKFFDNNGIYRFEDNELSKYEEDVRTWGDISMKPDTRRFINSDKRNVYYFDTEMDITNKLFTEECLIVDNDTQTYKTIGETEEQLLLEINSSDIKKDEDGGIVYNNNMFFPKGLSFFIPTPVDAPIIKSIVDNDDGYENKIDTLKKIYDNLFYLTDRFSNFSDEHIKYILNTSLRNFESNSLFIDEEEDNYLRNTEGEYVLDMNGKRIINSKRSQNIKFSGEHNPYVRRLYRDYGITPYETRAAGDYNILYYKPGDYFDKFRVDQIIKLFNKNAEYFKRRFNPDIETISDRFMVDHSDYKTQNVYVSKDEHIFNTFFIAFLTAMDYMTMEVDNRLTNDHMYSIDVDNKFKNFNITRLKDIPIKYKLIILDHIDQLINQKGTREVIVNILSLFNIEGMNLEEYYLVRYYKEKNLIYKLPKENIDNCSKSDMVIETFTGDPIVMNFSNPSQIFSYSNIFVNYKEIVTKLLLSDEGIKRIYMGSIKVYDTKDKSLTNTVIDFAGVNDTTIRIVYNHNKNTSIKNIIVNPGSGKENICELFYDGYNIDDDNVGVRFLRRKEDGTVFGETSPVALNDIVKEDKSWKIEEEVIKTKFKNFSSTKSKYINLSSKLDLINTSIKLSILYGELQKLNLDSLKFKFSLNSIKNAHDGRRYELLDVMFLANTILSNGFETTTKITKDRGDMIYYRDLNNEFLKKEIDRSRQIKLQTPVVWTINPNLNSGDLGNIRYQTKALKDIREASSHFDISGTITTLNDVLKNNYMILDKYTSDDFHHLFVKNCNENNITDGKEQFEEFKKLRRSFYHQFTTKPLGDDNVLNHYDTFEDYLINKDTYYKNIIESAKNSKEEFYLIIDEIVEYISSILVDNYDQNSFIGIEKYFLNKSVSNILEEILNTFKSFRTYLIYSNSHMNVGEHGIFSLNFFDYIGKRKCVLKFEPDHIYFTDNLRGQISASRLYDYIPIEEKLINEKIEDSFNDSMKFKEKLTLHNN